jgi:DNA-directed RNA polymerase specialized sigma24 family protein
VQRDRRAFEVAMDRWYPPTLRLARAILRNDQAVSDLVRKTWLTAVTRLDELDADADFGVLMLRETLQAASTRLETASERTAVPADRFEPETSRWAEWWSATPPPLVSQDRHRRLADALSDLAPAPAVVVLLRDLEGLTADQVETILGFPPDAQQALLHIARIAAWRALSALQGEQ